MQCETHNIQRILFMSPGMTENNLSVFSGKRQCFALRITFHQTVFLASTHPYHSIIWKSYLFIGTKDKIRIEIEVCVFVFVCVYNIMHNPSILCVCVCVCVAWMSFVIKVKLALKGVVSHYFPVSVGTASNSHVRIQWLHFNGGLTKTKLI